MPATFATLMTLDARLARAGHHPLTPWWRDQLQRFYAHPTARVFVGRVGRGGAKSHTSVWVGLNETLHGDFAVPPGEIHFWVQVSENKSEAAERLRLYCSALDALRIEYERSGDVIIIPGLRRGIRVLACQIGAVSGFRAFGYAADELAKWESADTAANPAEEVCTSLDAMTVQYSEARSLLISSPWGCTDFHAVSFDRGDTEFQVVAHAETWVANPAITREQCWRKAKGVERVMLREYGATPGPDLEHGYFDPGSIVRAFERNVPPYYIRKGPPAMCIDASSGRGDGFVWAVFQWWKEDPRQVYRMLTGDVPMRSPVTGEAVRKAGLPPAGPEILRVEFIDGLFDQFHDRIKPPQIIARIANDATLRNVARVHGDQHGEFFIDELFRRAGLKFVYHPVTGTSKAPACELVRQWFDTDMLSITRSGEASARLKNECLSFTETLTSGGRSRLEAPPGGHDDCVAVLIQAGLASMEEEPRDRLCFVPARGVLTSYRGLPKEFQ